MKKLAPIAVALLLVLTGCGSDPLDDYPGGMDDWEQERIDASQESVRECMELKGDVYLEKWGDHMVFDKCVVKHKESNEDSD